MARRQPQPRARSLAALCLLIFASACVETPPPGELPVISYTAPVNAYVDQTIVFDASTSSDPEGPLAGYGFDFGDGSNAIRSANPVVAHTYTEQGRYLTRVTIIDQRGNKFTELREISIVARDAVRALVCQPERPYCPPFYICDTDTLRCDADSDGDGVPADLDDDEPSCAEDGDCPDGLVCDDRLCR